MRKLSLLMIAATVFAGLSTVQAAEQAKSKTDVKPAAVKQLGSETAPEGKITATPAVKPAKAPTVSDDKWDFVEIGFWFDVPSYTANSQVYGVKVGAPFCSGKGVVNGIETAVFCGATDNINGLQACILCSKSKHLNGIQFSIVNYGEEVNGLQFGIVNVAKKKAFQLGIVNYIEGATFPWMPIINFRF
ncbi:MAG: hypothetical protein PHH77_12015 [Victivallaceae bacterium]|nr:hypothetical protein [Victivallaceae bacterium]